MSEMLSQAELDALLGDMVGGEDDLGADVAAPAAGGDTDQLSAEDMDVLGEIGNINMGTAATTLFTLLGHRVLITTPRVRVVSWKDLSAGYDRPAIGVRVAYRAGLRGSNVLILKDRDVKIIADLMMGGTGEVVAPYEMNELDMSAIGEAMNQMVGSASTSLSSMVKEKVDIEPPSPFMLDFSSTVLDDIGFAPTDMIACVAFRMEIGDLIDSEIMQIIPLDFAKTLVTTLREHFMGESTTTAAPPQVAQSVAPPPVSAAAPPPAPMAAAPPPPQYAPPPPGAQPQYAPPPHPQYAPHPGYPATPHYGPPPMPQNVNPAQFQPFDVNDVYQQKENMGIIMDVPLEITVELGRTEKKISEILEFSPGTVLELNKLAGEPIDILVNGKFVAKGEVVVIDENFGIRITDIISVDKRL